MKPFHPTHPTSVIAALLALCFALALPQAACAAELDSSIAACLKAWGDHPFGDKPQYKTLGTSFTVFGIGGGASDTEVTGTPTLVLINPSFNLLGVSNIDLMNPKGWYCMRTAVSIVGNVNLRAHCKAQLAGNSDGLTMRAGKGENRRFKDLSVTVMGRMLVERPCDAQSASR